jgi:hypothetical protein
VQIFPGLSNGQVTNLTKLSIRPPIAAIDCASDSQYVVDTMQRLAAAPLKQRHREMLDASLRHSAQPTWHVDVRRTIVRCVSADVADRPSASDIVSQLKSVVL